MIFSLWFSCVCTCMWCVIGEHMGMRVHVLMCGYRRMPPGCQNKSRSIKFRCFFLHFQLALLFLTPSLEASINFPVSRFYLPLARAGVWNHSQLLYPDFTGVLVWEIKSSSLPQIILTIRPYPQLCLS